MQAAPVGQVAQNWIYIDSAGALISTLTAPSGSFALVGEVDVDELGYMQQTDLRRQKSSANSGSLYRKNFITNGAFRVAQRGTNFSGGMSPAVYGLDKWKSGATSVGVTADPITGINSMDLSANALGQLRTNQYIESVDAAALAQKKVVFSFTARSNVPKEFTVYMLFFTALDSSAGAAKVSMGTFTPTTDATQYSFAFDMSVGTVTNGVGIQIFETVEASDTRDLSLSQVQLEIGESATEFEYRPYSEELAACIRHYRTLACSYALYVPTSATVGRMQNFTLSPEMRVSPTAPYSDFSAGGGATGVTLGGTQYAVAARVDGSGMTTNAANYITFNVQLSAEIE